MLAFFYVPKVKLFGLTTIKEYMLYGRILLVKGRKIIDYFIFDIAVEAALAGAGLQYIPQCYLMGKQEAFPGFIISRQWLLEKRINESPEMITCMSVILLQTQRPVAGHGAQQ